MTAFGQSYLERESTMKKRFLILALLLFALGLTGCGGGAIPTGGTGGGTSITVLMGKPEVAKQFEQMLTNYTKATGVSVTMIPLAGQDAYEKMTSLYASGNAPNILMVGQEFDEFKDKFLDLTQTDFVKKAGEGTLDFVTVDGKVYGTPVTVEAYGIIYNPAVVTPILGKDFDPTAIKTQAELADFFAKLQAGGAAPVTLSPMDWSLGAHLSNTVFAAQSANRDERHAFMQSLKEGKTDLMSNAAFNGWVDTLDLMVANNLHKDSPLSAVYEDGSMDLASGSAACWFMGNWAYPELSAIEKNDYRFIPVPVSNNPSDFANGKIAVGVPSYWCVDKSVSSAAQQKAAVDFLNWFLTTKEGQEYYVNELNFIPAYSGFKTQPTDAMSRQIAQLLEKSNTLEWMNTYYPAGGFQAMGASMQKYIGGKIDRAGMAAEFEAYWKSVK